ncbi:MAG: hypothetical protein U0T84_12745 [Chitinophagales bacterium]
MSIKHELQHIITGNAAVRNGEIIQSVANYLRGKKKTVSETENTKFLKEQETQILITFIENKSLWFLGVDESKYIGEGAEQKIYEHNDPNFVIKLNDGVFYASWLDYFNSLLIHNFFFPHLSYELLGFHRSAGNIFAVVKQPFVKSTESTNLENVREFLSANGFVNKKGNDYYHPGLGIILEDLHDENVLTEEGTLQFIDTVFFLMPSFYDDE